MNEPPTAPRRRASPSVAMAADRLSVAASDADGTPALEAAQAQPAFARLEAVASGGVQLVDGSVASSASGPIAADPGVDDLEKAVS